MRTLPSSLATSLFATLLIAGCGSSKQKAKPQAPASSARSEAKRAPEEARTERASGELREALLSLRRVHFAYDTTTLLPEARTALEEAALRLRAHPNVHVYIDGHCDSRGTSEYNLGLGERRARAASEYLMRLGIPEERLHLMTFGKEQPLEEGGTEIAHAKNRRVEFRLLRGDVRLVLEEGTLYDDRGQRLADRSL